MIENATRPFLDDPLATPRSDCPGACIEARLALWRVAPREDVLAQAACLECLRMARRLAAVSEGNRSALEQVGLLPPPALIPCCGVERPCDCRGPR
mgnify:CR=1 FL=1